MFGPVLCTLLTTVHGRPSNCICVYVNHRNFLRNRALACESLLKVETKQEWRKRAHVPILDYLKEIISPKVKLAYLKTKHFFIEFENYLKCFVAPIINTRIKINLTLD